jgi:hypothetical protein
MEQRQRAAGGPARVGGVGLPEGLSGGDGEEGAEGGVPLLDPLQVVLGQLPRPHLAAGQGIAQGEGRQAG